MFCLVTVWKSVCCWLCYANNHRICLKFIFFKKYSSFLQVSYVFSKILVSACCPLIMTAVMTTRSTPLILAGMAIERYISICFPLHYSHMCTVQRTIWIISVILVLSIAPSLTDFFITLAKEPASFFESFIFCDHSLLFRDRSIYYKNCAFDSVYFSFVFLALLYTYCKIMLTARAASTDLVSVKKARNTVLLHGVQLLLCMLAFVVPSMQAPLIQLFPQYGLEIRYINFLLVYIIPRFLSPMIYGVRDEKFRKYWIRYLLYRVNGKNYWTPGSKTKINVYMSVILNIQCIKYHHKQMCLVYKYKVAKKAQGIWDYV